MAANSEHSTHKVTIHKKTVKVTNDREDEDYPRSVKKENKYVLPWKTEKTPPSGFSNFKYFFVPDSSRVPNEQKLDDEPLMEMMKADRSRIENPPENGIRATWLGHASVLFQLDNVNVLVNPNFNNRGIKYYHPGDNKRYRQCVYNVADLPRIDCVFFTNTHFDYLDKSTVVALYERFGEFILFYCPMGVGEWIRKACTGDDIENKVGPTVVELDWWKEDEVDFIDHSKVEDDEHTNVTTFNIACTPSQSHHDRAFDDDNACLWASYVIMSPRYKLFIAGATGYCEVFKSIGRKYGPFHMAALPIGGYDPDWKFGYGNVTPEEAVKIHQDLLAMCSLAVAWGTFTIGNEFFLEPATKLKQARDKEGLSAMQFFTLKHGESRLIEIKEAEKEEPTPAEDTIENGHCVEEKKDDKTDADILQQLVDNFVEESKPEDEQNGEEKKEDSD